MSKKRKVTVTLEEGQEILIIHPDNYYALITDEEEPAQIYPGDWIANMDKVIWCHFSQRWEALNKGPRL